MPRRSFTLAIAAVSGVVACGTPPSTGAAASPPRDAPPATAVVVRTHGELRAIMHGGAGDGVVRLSDVIRSTTVAVGALADLAGEITILDGALHTSRVDGRAVASARGTGEEEAEAALLVVADVPRWRSIAIARDVAPESFDAAITEALRAAGVDTTHPVPFVVDGTFPVLDWHVVDGPHRHGAPAGFARSTPGAATLVGFFSTDHEGVFTHIGERTHVHALLPDATGHVDRVAIAAGATLRVPD